MVTKKITQVMSINIPFSTVSEDGSKSEIPGKLTQDFSRIASRVFIG